MNNIHLYNTQYKINFNANRKEQTPKLDGKIETLRTLIQSGKPVNECAQILNVSKESIYVAMRQNNIITKQNRNLINKIEAYKYLLNNEKLTMQEIANFTQTYYSSVTHFCRTHNLINKKPKNKITVSSIKSLMSLNRYNKEKIAEMLGCTVQDLYKKLHTDFIPAPKDINNKVEAYKYLLDNEKLTYTQIAEFTKTRLYEVKKFCRKHNLISDRATKIKLTLKFKL